MLKPSPRLLDTKGASPHVAALQNIQVTAVLPLTSIEYQGRVTPGLTDRHVSPRLPRRPSTASHSEREFAPACVASPARRSRGIELAFRATDANRHVPPQSDRNGGRYQSARSSWPQRVTSTAQSWDAASE